MGVASGGIHKETHWGEKKSGEERMHAKSIVCGLVRRRREVKRKFSSNEDPPPGKRKLAVGGSQGKKQVKNENKQQRSGGMKENRKETGFAITSHNTRTC